MQWVEREQCPTLGVTGGGTVAVCNMVWGACMANTERLALLQAAQPLTQQGEAELKQVPGSGTVC
jgi:hypothetical protein